VKDKTLNQSTKKESLKHVLTATDKRKSNLQKLYEEG